jgi:hypothetical protein
MVWLLQQLRELANPTLDYMRYRFVCIFNTTQIMQVDLIIFDALIFYEHK